MKRCTGFLLLLTVLSRGAAAQGVIPLDEEHWDVLGESYAFEEHLGKSSIAIQGGAMILKDADFRNGTIEFAIHLQEQQGFPGVFFRADERFNNGEQFFLRPHLSGKPDANQGAPSVQGITPWQLYHGPSYSFPYEYRFDDWTHVKVVVNEAQAQVYLDHAAEPHLSWHLTQPVRSGGILLRGGAARMHIADVRVDESRHEIVNFAPVAREPIEGLIPEWSISDMFEEAILEDPTRLAEAMAARTWQGTVEVEEGTAANISRLQWLRNGEPGSTVLAKVTIHSDRDQIKLFEFGYSDRVIAILNDTAIYRGTNKWRSRDYRYLGTIGLFDAIYLNLKEGENTLALAVSEEFGGWLVTGRIQDDDGLRISP